MSLRETIQSDLKTAMKARQGVTVSALRMLNAALKNREIEVQKPLTDDDIRRVIQTGIKQRKEAQAQYEAGGRDDLAEKERAEAEVLQAYMPEQLSEADLARVVEETIAELGASGMKDMGAVMKQVLAKCAGQAEGGQVNKLVREQLA